MKRFAVSLIVLAILALPVQAQNVTQFTFNGSQGPMVLPASAPLNYGQAGFQFAPGGCVQAAPGLAYGQSFSQGFAFAPVQRVFIRQRAFVPVGHGHVGAGFAFGAPRARFVFRGRF